MTKESEFFNGVGDIIAQTKNKKQISIRIDADVLEFFMAPGRGYQRRINKVLRLYMIALTSEAGK